MSLRSNQRGFTLIELIISATLFGVIALAFTNFTIRALSTYQYLQAQSFAAGDLTGIMSRVTKVTRGATDLISTQDNNLVMYAYFSPRDAVVDKVRYFVTGTTLQVGVTPASGTAPNYTYNVADEKITTLAKNLTMGSAPIFTYYDDNGAKLASGFAITQVREVGVTITMNPDPKRLKVPLTNTTIVSLRNKKTNL